MAVGSYQHSFNRYELKYLMPVEDSQAFMEGISAYMAPDAYAGSDGKYRISSLYYDSSSYHLFWEKVEGLKFRRKLRVRRYEDVESDDCMIEIKQRTDKTLQKIRVKTTLNEAFTLLPAPDTFQRPENIELSFDEAASAPAVAKQLVSIYNLQPTIVISYTREAFQSIYSPGLRITIDTNLRCRSHNLDWGKARGQEHYFISPEYSIVEIKFNESVPRWLTHHLGEFECELKRVSKYCCGIDTLFFNSNVL